MIPTKESIEAAYHRIATYIHRTPVMTSSRLDVVAGCQLFFKCENFQKVGAFKARGAMNAVLQIPLEERAKGVATHSSGNHAQAVARAAQIIGMKAYIVMPHNSAEIKKKGVLSYGGEIFTCEPTQQAREAMLKEVIKTTGATEVHPFNNFAVMTGQATVAKELLEDIENLDFIVAPVGGGGLLSGTAMTAKFYSPATKVVGAEPEGADDAFRSMQSGKIEPSGMNSIADGLLTSLGDKTFSIIQKEVEEIITASDKEIISAMRLVWERLKIIIEPSAAVTLAVVLKQKEKFYGKRVGLILSGGNIDLEKAGKFFSPS